MQLHHLETDNGAHAFLLSVFTIRLNHHTRASAAALELVFRACKYTDSFDCRLAAFSSGLDIFLSAKGSGGLFAAYFCKRVTTYDFNDAMNHTL